MVNRHLTATREPSPAWKGSRLPRGSGSAPRGPPRGKASRLEEPGVLRGAGAGRPQRLPAAWEKKDGVRARKQEQRPGARSVGEARRRAERAQRGAHTTQPHSASRRPPGDHLPHPAGPLTSGPFMEPVQVPGPPHTRSRRHLLGSQNSSLASSPTSSKRRPTAWAALDCALRPQHRLPPMERLRPWPHNERPGEVYTRVCVCM